MGGGGRTITPNVWGTPKMLYPHKTAKPKCYLLKNLSQLGVNPKSTVTPKCRLLINLSQLGVNPKSTVTPKCCLFIEPKQSNQNVGPETQEINGNGSQRGMLRRGTRYKHPLCH